MWRQKGKYGNRRTKCASNHNHPSALESAVCDLCLLRQRAGEIKSYQAQAQVYLTKAQVGYKADFKCIKPDGSPFWIESKGVPGVRWIVIQRLWRVYGPGPLEIWAGHYTRPTLVKTIIPEGDVF